MWCIQLKSVVSMTVLAISLKEVLLSTNTNVGQHH